MYCEECGKEIKEPNEQGDFICEDCEIYCDKCGEDVEELYKVDGEELCKECLLNNFEKVEL